MKSFRYHLTAIIFFFSATCNITYPQSANLHKYHSDFYPDAVHLKPVSISPTLPLAIALLSVFYIFNPIIQYEDKKISAGLTKEFSVGFGYFGEHRAAFEYSYIFRSDVRNSIKLSYKYDILLKDGLQPSNRLQTTTVLSIGAGYFTNFEDRGFFPEISYGFSVRNHKLLFYPHIKFRYIFMLNKVKTNITDLSFGVMIGIANPFIDVRIRTK